jgi:hypothetical protein
MEPSEPHSRRRGARLALVSLGLLALLAIVAFSSRGGFGHRSRASPTGDYFSYAFTVFLIVFVLAIPVAVWAFALRAREDLAPRRSFQARVIGGLLTIVFVGLIVAAVVSFKHHASALLHLDPTALEGGAKSVAHRHAAKARYEPQFKWIVVWIGVACAAIGAVVAAFLYRRRTQGAPAPLADQASVGEELAASMTDAIDDLEAEPDPRRAVIAAYARMESVLARRGLRRRLSETPLEYLQRVLLGLTGRQDAVARLTSLFERAKFSRGEIDGSMKQDAIGALRDLRDDLQGSAQ